ncbi:MAG: helix-hairpin-helix domain-containing protein [Myxococcales bacterium]|nr:helix-hairpin-helix domain-containing protein [Myxococcales bacterium]
MTLSISSSISKLTRHLAPLAAVAMLVGAMGGSWTRVAYAAPSIAAQQAAAKPSPTTPRDTGDVDEPPAKKGSHQQLVGKLNLNAANEEQLQLLPTVGPAKAERIIAWRSKNGGFKRIADLRRVKGFGYKTFKKLEPYLDIKGETTLTAK